MIATAPVIDDQHQADRLIDRILYQAERNPAHDAVVTPSYTLSYAQLAQLAQAQISVLADLGIDGDSIVGIRCADEARHLLLCIAATHFAATTCTIPTYEDEQAQNSLLESCGATHVVDEQCAIDPAALINSAPAGLQASNGDARFLFSTSGTTGQAKLVVHHDSDLVAQAHRHVESEQERFACVASIEQNFAKRHRLYCTAMGASNVFLNDGLQSLVSQCESLKVNVLHVSAFQAQELLAIPDIDRLAHIRLKLGGSHVPFSLREQLRNKITRNLQAGYGTTETGAIGFTDPTDPDAAESVGRPLPGIEVRVVGEDRKPLETEQRGEIAIRCAGMFRGYLGNDKLTETRLAEDWFYTGDIGYLDRKQRIHLCGRADDMFLFNSMNIYPQDIESQICQHPAVLDAAVIPKRSVAHGNIPVALVVLDGDAKEALPELKRYVRKQVGVRSPRQFILVQEIPRNATGKIARNEALGLSTESDQIRQSIVEALAAACASDQDKMSLIAAFENGDKDVKLTELGIDSLTRMEIMVAMELNFDTVIMPQEFPRLRTLNDIVTRVLNPPTETTLETSNENRTAEFQSRSLPSGNKPWIVRFFQRIFSYCHTASHFNKALTTFEAKLTPPQLQTLYQWHLGGGLIPADADARFQSILSLWFENLNRMMGASGKSDPEPFAARRIGYTLTRFCRSGFISGQDLAGLFLDPRRTPVDDAQYRIDAAYRCESLRFAGRRPNPWA